MTTKRISLIATILALSVTSLHAATKAECEDAHKENNRSCAAGYNGCHDGCYEIYGSAAGGTEFDSMTDCYADCSKHQAKCERIAKKALDSCLRSAE